MPSARALCGVARLAALSPACLPRAPSRSGRNLRFTKHGLTEDLLLAARIVALPPQDYTTQFAISGFPSEPAFFSTVHKFSTYTYLTELARERFLQYPTTSVPIVSAAAPRTTLGIPSSVCMFTCVSMGRIQQDEQELKTNHEYVSNGAFPNAPRAPH